MKHIKLFEQYSSHYGYDNLLDFIKETNYPVRTYLHTTKKEETCYKIMELGYQYDEFYKTTDEINDVISLDYKMSLRDAYGDYTIIIQVSININPEYNLLTIKEPFMGGEDGDQLVYTLPPHFIKGYFNRKTGEIVKNPNFNPQ